MEVVKYWFIYNLGQILKIKMFTLLIVYMKPLCIYTQSLYILWFISSNEIHQYITYVSVNNCIYFKYSYCTLKPGENSVHAVRRQCDKTYMTSLWRQERYLFSVFRGILAAIFRRFSKKLSTSAVVHQKNILPDY